MGMALLWLASWPGAAPPPLGACWARNPKANTPAPISRKPARCAQEATCSSLGRVSELSVARISFFSMSFFLSFFLMFPLLFGDLAQLVQRLFAPALMRLQLQLAKARRHLPIGCV